MIAVCKGERPPPAAYEETGAFLVIIQSEGLETQLDHDG